MTKTHPIYGRGPNKEVKFAVEIDSESTCYTCIHNKVCNKRMEDRCQNYEFGTSEGKGCQGCLHRYTRSDRLSIPCFSCADYQYDDVPRGGLNLRNVWLGGYHDEEGKLHHARQMCIAKGFDVVHALKHWLVEEDFVKVDAEAMTYDGIPLHDNELDARKALG